MNGFMVSPSYVGKFYRDYVLLRGMCLDFMSFFRVGWMDVHPAP